MDTYGNVRRHLVGLVMNASIIPLRGAKIFSGDREVGWVSSATHSPQLKTSIALAFPLRDFSAPGTTLNIEVDGARHDATVRALPFYRRT
jgi:glycine cleavage system aminomethyltransferase T